MCLLLCWGAWLSWIEYCGICCKRKFWRTATLSSLPVCFKDRHQDPCSYCVSATLLRSTLLLAMLDWILGSAVRKSSATSSSLPRKVRLCCKDKHQDLLLHIATIHACWFPVPSYISLRAGYVFCEYLVTEGGVSTLGSLLLVATIAVLSQLPQRSSGIGKAHS